MADSKAPPLNASWESLHDEVWAGHQDVGDQEFLALMLAQLAEYEVADEEHRAMELADMVSVIRNRLLTMGGVSIQEVMEHRLRTRMQGQVDEIKAKYAWCRGEGEPS